MRKLSGYIINLPEVEGGRRIKNPWIQHVKDYSKENNISYACAIPKAKTTYQKMIRAKKMSNSEENKLYYGTTQSTVS